MSRLVGGLVIALIVGCGDGSGRHRLTGRVTWQGQPVAAGRIVFQPDAEKGNAGPAGVAIIRGGSYATEPAMGTVAGPHIARFLIGDGQGRSEMAPYGRFLTTEELDRPVDLPPRGGTVDFALP